MLNEVKHLTFAFGY